MTASSKDIIIVPLIVKNQEIFSGQKFYWLGMIFIFLAIFAFASNWLSRKTPPVDLDSLPITLPMNGNQDHGEGEKKNLLEKLNFKQVHENYQQSYLDLVKKISESQTSRIDLRKDMDIFKSYKRAKTDLKETLVKVEEYEKDFRLKCFAKMRSIILAVLFYDRQTQKRMSRFIPEELVKVGALQEIPECPRGGKYSIIYKDGRRLFHCSIHGTLKN